MQRYAYDNDADLCRLFEHVFGKPMGKTESQRHFQWEYLENPAGRPIIYVARSNENRIISAYPTMPLRMRLMDSSIHGSLSFDSMTHPQFQGQRLFTKLGREVYQYLENNNYPLTYGFPNGNIQKLRINQLQWFDVAEFPLLIKFIDFQPLFFKYLPNRIISKFLGSTFNGIFNLIFRKDMVHFEDILTQETNVFDEEFDAFWNQNRSLFQICVERDSIYLKWRYSRPEETYIILKIEHNGAMAGYAVLKIEDRFNLRTGFILDFVVTPVTKYIDALLFGIMVRFRQEKVALVSALMMAHSPYSDLFGKYGFLRIPPCLHPQKINFGARINIDGKRNHEIRNPRNWFITWGDTDLL